MTKYSKKSKGFTDYHCHILPGLDDGPSTIKESMKMARLLAAAGYTTVYCTPHMLKHVYDADNDTVRNTVALLQQEIDKEKLPIKLFAGREYYLDEFFSDYLQNPMPLGDTRFLLIEIPPYIFPEMVRDTFIDIMESSYIPMIAHPERCQIFSVPEKRVKKLTISNRYPFITIRRGETERPASDLIQWLTRTKCAFQANLGSFSGSYGKSVQSKAREFSKANIYNYFGTDAHSAAECLPI
jgi:protein-tyrosine phosphatase